MSATPPARSQLGGWVSILGCLCAVSAGGLLGYQLRNRYEGSLSQRSAAGETHFHQQTTLALSPGLQTSNQSNPNPTTSASELARICPIRFVDRAAAVGLDFAYNDGATGHFYLMETLGAGIAAFDYDNDQWLDLFLVNGRPLPLQPPTSAQLAQLYQNLWCSGPTPRFAPVTAKAGLGEVMYGHGAATGDFDQDGFVDLLVVGYGQMAFYRNHGDGTFSEASLPLGLRSAYVHVADPGIPTFMTSAVFADLDRDGDLDLYVASYAEVSLVEDRWCGQNRRLHCNPRDFPSQADLIFENLGNEQFALAPTDWGFTDTGGRGLGLVVGDFTADGLADVFVANDSTEAFFFAADAKVAPTPPSKSKETPSSPIRSVVDQKITAQSQTLPMIHYEDGALPLGIALNGRGRTMAGMGVAFGDCDRNGYPDLAVTDFYQAPNALFLNHFPSGFLDQASLTGLAEPSQDKLGWAAIFLDADSDGRRDLFIANGHVSDFGDRPYRMTSQFFWNVPSKQHQALKCRPANTQRSNCLYFREVSDICGTYFHRQVHGRGAALGDWNNDGRPDLAVSLIRQQMALLINETANSPTFPPAPLILDLVGTRSNRSGYNVNLRFGWRTTPKKSTESDTKPEFSTKTLLEAKTELTSKWLVVSAQENPKINSQLPVAEGERWEWWTEETMVGGYLSSNDPRCLIAFGERGWPDRIEIHWPTGTIQTITPVPGYNHYLVKEPINANHSAK